MNVIPVASAWFRRALAAARSPDGMALIVIVTAAGALRLALLGMLPAPAGDEGAWAAYALHLHLDLPHDAIAGSEYASSIYPRLLAWSMDWFGPTFLGARVIGAVAGTVTVLVVWKLARPWGLGPAIVAALVVAVHPMHVAWSRTASVPYVIQGLVAWTAVAALTTTSARSRAAHAVGVFLMALGLHFGPIHAATGLAVAIVLVSSGRWRVLVHPLGVLALVSGLLLVAPLVAYDVGETIRFKEPTDASPALLVWLSNLVMGVGGGWTLLHFSPADGAWLVRGGVVCGVSILALGIAAHRRAGPQDLIARVAVWQVACVAVVLPLLLVGKGLDWTSNKIDRDRYLVTTVPAIALCLGAAFAHLRRARWLAVVATAVLAAGTSGIYFVFNLRHSGPDRGVELPEGGGYRAWRIARGPAPLVQLVANEIRAFVARNQSNQRVWVMSGDHAFVQPLLFLLDDLPVIISDGHRARPDGPTCWVAYRPEVFIGAFLPAKIPKSNARVMSDLLSAQNARPGISYSARGGAPLAAVRCAGPLLRPSPAKPIDATPAAPLPPPMPAVPSSDRQGFGAGPPPNPTDSAPR